MAEIVSITRRDFLAGLMALAAAPHANSQSLNSYCVSVLGDIHYDGTDPQTYHAQAYALSKVRDEFVRNARMWETFLPALIESSAASVTDKTAFVLQLGDLIQGDTYSELIHARYLLDAKHVLQKAYAGLPILTVCGNHDIRAGLKPGVGERIYREFFTDWMSESTARLKGAEVKSTSFAMMLGDDLWLFLDFNDEKNVLAHVKSFLKTYPKSRYTFVASHGAILPMDLARHRWFTLGKPALDEARRELRALLAARHAICLTGHSHTVEVKDWVGDNGRITEFVANSVALGHAKTGGFAPYPETFKALRTASADFGRWAIEGKRPPKENLSPVSRKSTLGLRALYEEYRPGLRLYQAARAYGHYVLEVSDKAVLMHYFGGSAHTRTKTFQLR